ncbi:uncharacterized protein [Fopius arisanus]|uniref:Uncharacterized protein isoform X2 n=1 Tax=Fopius arisanus TaxID=64838 RepID=A0A9R1TVJ6_9HYME|nr:PREDICTED: uncharacterized protein LOC105263492 isoform X2 [Fopius arisanus]
MSRAESRNVEGDRSYHPRSCRTNSVALPASDNFLPSTGTRRQPPLPRRHSETPTVTITRTPPPLPARRQHERPIFITTSGRSGERKNSLDGLVKSESITAWRRASEDSDGKLIDLETSRLQNGFESLSKPQSAEHEHGYTTRKFDDDRVENFDASHGGAFKSSFEELQKTVRDLEKRLHEGIVRSVDHSCCEVANQRRSRDYFNKNSRLQRTKFESDTEDRHEAEKRSKLEALQATSRNLEKCLQSEQQPTKVKYNVDMERARNILQNNLRKERGVERLEKLPKATQTNLPPPLSAICQSPVQNKPASVRQDSNVSSDSFSQTSSPSYTSKTMEAPLLPHKHINGRVPGRALIPESENPPGSPITKSMSTPASLQTIVRFHSGSNMSLHHRIIRDIRRPSSHYVTRGRIKFRHAQVFVNAVALLAIAGGFLAYFKSYPEGSVRFENRTVLKTGIQSSSRPLSSLAEQKNPAPGICLPVIVTFCMNRKVPYNFTVFPNYMGNFGQRDAQHELENYEAVVDVRCYELAALFLCNVFVPKCGSRGQVVRPCRSLCNEMTRRCGFFLNVFGLKMPDYLDCDYFPENASPDICVGHHEVKEAALRAEKPVCTSGFQCDSTRCIPVDWKCDGHVDCADQTDEIDCGECASPPVQYSVNSKSKNQGIRDVIAKPTLHCGERRCMSPTHVCDGVLDCPWGQDERNCLRLSERNGDIGKGRLQVYHAENQSFIPACITHWESTSAQAICRLLGYNVVNSSMFSMKSNNMTVSEPQIDTSQRWRLAQKGQGNLLKDLQTCTDHSDYRTVELTCSEYACGRRRNNFGNAKPQRRIVGGVESSPGDWPFLAALLGGPEEIFYCAGVLISDQWVLTAAHCVGKSLRLDHSAWDNETIRSHLSRREKESKEGCTSSKLQSRCCS